VTGVQTCALPIFDGVAARAANADLELSPEEFDRQVLQADIALLARNAATHSRLLRFMASYNRDPTAPVPVSITVDSHLNQVEGADVIVLNAQNIQVVVGKTEINETNKRPKFNASLPPGTYTIVTSWRDRQGKVHGGQQTYTVTTGENIPNVAVEEGGYQNPPAQGTNPKPIGEAALELSDQATVPIFEDGFDIGDTSAWWRSFQLEYEGLPVDWGE